jgi:hypothetical protein
VGTKILIRDVRPGCMMQHRAVPLVRIAKTVFDDPIVRSNTPLPEPTIDERDTQEMPAISADWLLLCKKQESDDWTV